MDYIHSGIDSLRRNVRESLDVTEKRNVIASMLAGILFFSGWWIIFDVAARYSSDDFHGGFYLLGISGTISFIIVNSISNSQLTEDGYDSVNPRAAKGCLLLGFIFGFTALLGSVWILIGEYGSSKYPNPYPGVALMIQNLLIFFGSLTFKFGRVDESMS